jgi:hypothetical protein
MIDLLRALIVHATEKCAIWALALKCRRLNSVRTFSASLLLASACSGSPARDPELALQEGARLRATHGTAEIRVFAGRKFERRFEWNDCKLDANMSARSSRWMGSLGIYDPAGRLWLDPSAGCRGISRPVVQEAQLHFADERSAERWIARYSKSYANVVWTNDGLLVAWDVRPERAQLNVDVYQVCVRGKRPEQLAGALDKSISVTSASNEARRPCVTVSDDVIAKTQADWQDFWSSIEEPPPARERS